MEIQEPTMPKIKVSEDLQRKIDVAVENIKSGVDVSNIYEAYCEHDGTCAEMKPSDCMLILSIGHSVSNELKDFCVERSTIIEDLRRSVSKCFVGHQNIWVCGKCSVIIEKIIPPAVKCEKNLILPVVKSWAIYVDSQLVGVVSAHLNVGIVSLLARHIHRTYIAQDLLQSEIESLIEKSL